MGKQHLSVLIIAVLAVALTMSSCRRNQLNRETSMAEDNSLAQALWEDVSNQVEGSSTLNESDSLPTWNKCAVIRIDTLGSPFPLLFTVDFGEENCLCFDGKYRRGSIIYETTGSYRAHNAVITMNTDDYYVNDYKIEGTRTTTNTGLNSDGFHEYEIKVENGAITTPEGETITWDSKRRRVWTEGSETGYLTPDTINGGYLGWSGITDDVYEITGTASGTSREGRNFTIEINSPLVVKLNCKWVTQGILTLTPEQLRDRVIDYGYGNCDNKATVTIGDNEYDVLLRE